MPKRLFLDGKEVANCWYLDGRRRIAKIYSRNSEGNTFLLEDHKTVASEIVRFHRYELVPV